MITTEDKLRYLKRKLSDRDLPIEERFDIIDFFTNHAGLFNKDLDIEKFFKELNRLTGCI